MRETALWAVDWLDDKGKAAWIASMVLGFVLFWPIGLAILAYMIWSGRMACGNQGGKSRWFNRAGNFDRVRPGNFRTSGNVAFDEYREETLRRLEDEQREFGDFLSRLRAAKDKAEFDAFMTERRRPRRPEEGRSAAGDTGNDTSKDTGGERGGSISDFGAEPRGAY